MMLRIRAVPSARQKRLARIRVSFSGTSRAGSSEKSKRSYKGVSRMEHLRQVSAKPQEPDNS